MDDLVGAFAMHDSQIKEIQRIMAQRGLADIVTETGLIIPRK